MKGYALTLCALLFCFVAFADDFFYGEASQAELRLKQYDKDTFAHAVVLSEYGKATLYRNNGEVRVVFDYHVKIKIFDNKGFDKGTVSILRNRAGDDADIIGNINAITTYIDDNGITKRVELDPKQIFNQGISNGLSVVKFALPGLRNGCIIEYTYRTISPFVENFHPWYFQDDIPKMYSEYNISVADGWRYNALIKGASSVTNKVIAAEKNCSTAQSPELPANHIIEADCPGIVYKSSDIPAFVPEDYMTAVRNFACAIYFELADYVTPYGTPKKYAKTWDDVDNNLKHADYFGGQLKRTGLLKSYITPLIANKTTELDKAKAIYAFIQKDIKWDNTYSRGSIDGIAKALKKHNGDAADINLALVTALNAAGINTEAVLLSTRENGVVNKLYPTESDFDYIIAKVNIADKVYLLDATDPLLSFGMVPLKCINGDGRVMSLNKPSYWMDIKEDKIKKSSIALDLTLQEDGKIKGTLVRYGVGYDAYERRKEIKSFNNTDEFLDDISNKSGKIIILNSTIANVDSLEKPLIETYQIELKAYETTENMIAFNPFILDRLTINPFKLEERTFPVDMGIPSDQRFVLTMHLPEKYAIEFEPKKTAMGLADNGGRFITDFVPGNNMFTFSNVTQFNKSIYSSNEYPGLKEFFNKIISTENTELTFKKQQ
jgi:hypothetical protein